MRGWARWVDPTPKSIVADGQFIFPFDIGDLVSDLYLHLASGACTPANMLLLEFQLNGITQWTLTGLEIDAINQYFGFPTFTGVAGQSLRIPFGLNDMIDSPLRDLTALNTGSRGPTGNIIKTGQIKVTLQGATDATFEIYARVSDQRTGGPGVIRRFTKFNSDNTLDLTPISSVLPKGDRQSAMWARMYFATSVGTVLQTMILADGKRVDDLIPVAVTNNLQTDEGLDPTGGGLFDSTWTTSAEGIGVAATSFQGKIINPGNLPYFDTLPFKDKTIQVYVKNSDGSGTNTIILETIGAPA